MNPAIGRRDFIKGVSAAAALGLAGRGLGAAAGLSGAAEGPPGPAV